MAGMFYLVLGIGLAIVYFKLYHSMFQVTYFGNPFTKMAREFIICFILGVITAGLFSQLLIFLLGSLGGIVLFLLGIGIILAVIGGVAYGIYRIIKYFKNRNSDIPIVAPNKDETVKKESDTLNNEILDEVNGFCPACGNLCSQGDQFCENCGSILE